jgi:hypothetical protein
MDIRVLSGRRVKDCWLQERESECCLEEGQESAVWKKGERVLAGRRVRDCWLEERESECCLEEGQESAVWKKGERVL